jgi:hypothetical protein
MILMNSDPPGDAVIDPSKDAIGRLSSDISGGDNGSGPGAVVLKPLQDK